MEKYGGLSNSCVLLEEEKKRTLFCVILRCILTLKVDILTLICSKETGSIAFLNSASFSSLQTRSFFISKG